MNIFYHFYFIWFNRSYKRSFLYRLADYLLLYGLLLTIFPSASDLQNYKRVSPRSLLGQLPKYFTCWVLLSQALALVDSDPYKERKICIFFTSWRRCCFLENMQTQKPMKTE
jgi:hypothetical protein